MAEVECNMIEGYIFCGAHMFSVFEVDIVLNRYYICYKIIVCEINIVCCLYSDSRGIIQCLEN